MPSASEPSAIGGYIEAAQAELDAIADPIRYRQRQLVIETNNGSPHVDDDHGRRVAALNHWMRVRH